MGTDYEDAKAAITARGRASAVVLQGALGIGYMRALCLLDRMTQDGLLGPDTPDGSRAILFKPGCPRSESV